MVWWFESIQWQVNVGLVTFEGNSDYCHSVDDKYVSLTRGFDNDDASSQSNSESQSIIRMNLELQQMNSDVMIMLDNDSLNGDNDKNGKNKMDFYDDEYIENQLKKQLKVTKKGSL